MKKFLLSILSPHKSPLWIVVIAYFCFLSVRNDITGDLGKIGQIVFSEQYHLQEKFQTNDFETNNIEWCDVNSFHYLRLLFLGDSFTRGSVYADYLSKNLSQKAAKFFATNIESPEQTFIALCNSGEEVPRVVILESVERSCFMRLSSLDFRTQVIPNASVYKPYMDKQTTFTTYYKNQLINNKAVRHLQLGKSMFSCPKKEKELYFYYEDLLFPTEEQMQIANSKLDTLFCFAKEHGIILFYVVAADKYDVYQEFVIGNKYPEKRALEAFAKYDDNPYFVNTKDILLKKARQGVADLYYADDTHWSPIGAKIIAEEIARRIDSLGIFQN